jgi:hypothetical protein
MENKQTAIQKLAIIIEDRIGVSTMADQSKEGIIGYQMALVGIKLELKHLLELEREQIIDAHGSKNRGGFKSHGEFFLDILTGEQYYNETYKQQDNNE